VVRFSKYDNGLRELCIGTRLCIWFGLLPDIVVVPTTRVFHEGRGRAFRVGWLWFYVGIGGAA
jgi:hypothetical protein